MTRGHRKRALENVDFLLEIYCSRLGVRLLQPLDVAGEFVVVVAQLDVDY